MDRDDLEDDELETSEEFEETTFESDERAATPMGNGMPLGNEITPLIQAHQVRASEDGSSTPAFDDNAALTIALRDSEYAQRELANNSWLAEWQYIDYLYQSPNYDRDWRSEGGRAARISRFNVAKNRNTISNQVRRGIFSDENPFLLEAEGPLAGDVNVQTILDGWTELFNVLSDRADFEYNMSLFIECQVLQGTAIAIPVWEEKPVKRKTRTPKAPPVTVDMPLGPPKKIDTWESDQFTLKTEIVMESWPYFEYRRLGTTVYDPKWRTPNRPELSAAYKVDYDYITFDDLQQMREADCYKNIPSNDDLIKFFLHTPQGDAEQGSQTAQSMNTEATVVLHAQGDNRQTSKNPFERPFLKRAYWTSDRVIEFITYEGRHLVIRNGESEMGDHGLGYSATWWNIDNSGYGIGQGRLNAGDQRMDQGVLNEVLKMIGYPLNAPILYNAASGNAPTQNTIAGLGTFVGIHGLPPEADVNKAFGFMRMPEIPADAWKIYQLGKDGGEDLVGANAATMQGATGGGGATMMRSAAGVNRLASKADENLSDPIGHLEYVIKRWCQFLQMMVFEQMPTWEIREILSKKFGDAILNTIDFQSFINAKFNIKVLAGQKLAAKQQIAQLIPFLLQLLQQPQLMEYMHQKGWTINFLAIEKIFMRVSELRGAEDIIVPLTDQEKQAVQQSNPAMMKAQIEQTLLKMKGANRIAEIQEQGKQDLQHTIVDKSMDHVEGSVPLDLAEARLDRNTDMTELQGGIPGMGQ